LEGEFLIALMRRGSQFYPSDTQRDTLFPFSLKKTKEERSCKDRPAKEKRARSKAKKRRGKGGKKKTTAYSDTLPRGGCGGSYEEGMKSSCWTRRIKQGLASRIKKKEKEREMRPS